MYQMKNKAVASMGANPEVVAVRARLNRHGTEPARRLFTKGLKPE